MLGVAGASAGRLAGCLAGLGGMDGLGGSGNFWDADAAACEARLRISGGFDLAPWAALPFAFPFRVPLAAPLALPLGCAVPVCVEIIALWDGVVEFAAALALPFPFLDAGGLRGPLG